tara:strand:- start:435 stop:821 length:387 start_codon:yes stop_codon:yes gene_type:complete
MSDLIKLVWVDSNNKVESIAYGTTTAGYLGDPISIADTTTRIDKGYTYNSDGTFTGVDIPLNRSTEEHLIILRTCRDAKLAESDWTILPDSPFSDSKIVEWKSYRQTLRDLPANTSDPSSPTWPTKPS